MFSTGEKVRIISVRENPKYKEIVIKYFQDKWSNENSMNILDYMKNTGLNILVQGIILGEIILAFMPHYYPK